MVNDKLVAMTAELRCQAGRMSALLEITLQLACEHDPERLHSGFCRTRASWSPRGTWWSLSMPPTADP